MRVLIWPFSTIVATSSARSSVTRRPPTMRVGTPSASASSVDCGTAAVHQHDADADLVQHRRPAPAARACLGRGKHLAAGLQHEGLALVHADVGGRVLERGDDDRALVLSICQASSGPGPNHLVQHGHLAPACGCAPPG
jgi:hypothetical protein